MRVDLPEAEPDSAPHRREAPEENAETAPANEATGTAEAGRAAEADVAPLASEAPSAPQDTAPAAEPPDPAEAEFDAHVRAIVRAELEGALGERISANLRKIIRREVTRALNARLGE
ncbi:MAG: hypothetical protein D6754_09025 [Alphaproteobacteria bacterium]|nr:MAG: hypothetical protein D6754_09025 [Alphaproteobacteria bacterium]